MASETQRGHSRNLPTVTVRPYTDETTDSGERRAESGEAIAGSEFGLRSTVDLLVLSIHGINIAGSRSHTLTHWRPTTWLLRPQSNCASAPRDVSNMATAGRIYRMIASPSSRPFTGRASTSASCLGLFQPYRMRFGTSSYTMPTTIST